MNLLLMFLLSTSSIETPQSDDLPSVLETSNFSSSISELEKIRAVFHKVSKGTFYFGAGAALGSASLLARLGWGVCLISPWASTAGNECLLFSHLCASAAERVFDYIFNGSASASTFFNKLPSSQSSWYLNQKLLSQIPTFTKEEKELLLFLEKHWLAKSTGFFSSVIDWVCPCFGITVQVHPETSSSYARSTGINFSQTYKNRVAAWKQSLPHPQYFPLVLTRPANLQDYLPSCVDVSKSEKIETTIENASLKMHTEDSKVIVDLTHLFQENIKDEEEWLQTWKGYEVQLVKACKERNVNPKQLFCIQRLQEEEIGGIRLLPLLNSSSEEIDLQHQFLIDWISNFGLSANRIELDRWPISSNIPIHSSNVAPISIARESKEEVVSYLNSFDQNWKSTHPQKNFMLKGTLQVLKGLFITLSEGKWNEIINSPTRSSIAYLSFLKIKERLKLLEQEGEDVLFFDAVSHIEQIHADLCSLLEIFTPFTFNDFPAIYENLLTSIPQNLKPLTSYGIHSSGMTSLTGIFKSVERTLGRAPRVLYGENTYFECINAAKRVSNASSIDEATEDDWKDVDLLLVQFNPVLKRIDFQVTEYRVEKISEILLKALNARQEKPLTLALDCTLDFIDSVRVARLLDQFQEEIQAGALNIICYRSGLKFDLFGMDNYCGAPFYMIHNHDPKWTSFDSLPSDPVLQTDRLSLNWFCLAYQSAAPQLELYRKQIFDNTRAFLNKVPARLLTDPKAAYRIIPVEQEADPAFIDIKISGLFHQIRGSALAGGCLYMKCMEGGHPIFYRPSLGFYHPNFTMLFGEESSTIRLTLGLDPAQVDLLVECFEMIDALNGSETLPHKSLLLK